MHHGDLGVVNRIATLGPDDLCLNLDEYYEWFNLTMPQFPHLLNGGDNSNNNYLNKVILTNQLE
jgi:hypothetical protein